MKRYVILFWLCATLLYSAASPSLERAHKWLAEQTTQSVLKAYHEYKNARINAIMDASKPQHIEAVRGIVKAGKLLHMDVSKYQEELAGLEGKSYEAPVAPAKPAAPKVNYLKNIKWQSGSIILTFRDIVESSQVNHFVLDKKFNQKYRYIFDISAQSKAGLMLSRQHLDDIRINSDEKEKMRLVLENDTPIAMQHTLRGNELIIAVGESSKRPAKENAVLLTKESYLAQEPPKALKKKIIVIDPGHGGKDPGAMGYRNYREKIIVFDLAVALKKELDAMGYRVFLTRQKDVFVNLRDRTAFANNKEADLFISLHANAVAKKGSYQKHHGIETYFLSQARSERAKNVAATENSDDMDDMNYFGKESFLHFLNAQKILASNKLAIDLQRGMLSHLRKSYKSIKDGGVKEGPFWVLVGAQMPAVLVEVGFITNPKEAKNLVNTTYQQRMAYGMALGVANYFKMNP